MEAVVCYGPEDYRFVTDYAMPDADGEGEILCKVLLAGICAGDAKCYHRAPLFWGDDKGRQPYCVPPVVPGHEFVLEVVKSNRTGDCGFAPGDMVVAEQIVPCNDCRFCRRPGQYHMCQPHTIFGFKHQTDGSWAQFMVLPKDAIVYKIPDGVEPRAAVYTEPLACAVHAVERGNIQSSVDVVVVSGAGALGLGMIAHAKTKQPKLLIALDMQENRLQVAKRCGADVCLNPGQVDVVEKIKELTEGYGCDVYIEATGNPQSVVQGLNCIAKLGTFVEFSVFQKETCVDWTIIGDTKELNIHGAHLSPKPCYELALDLLASGKMPVATDIVTHVLPLSQFKKGIDLVNSGADNSIKVVLDPNQQ